MIERRGGTTGSSGSILFLFGVSNFEQASKGRDYVCLISYHNDIVGEREMITTPDHTSHQ